MLLGHSRLGVDPVATLPLWWDEGAAVGVTMTLSGTLANVSGALAGQSQIVAVINGLLSPTAGTWSALVSGTGTLRGVLADVSGILAGDTDNSATVEITLYSDDGKPIPGVVVRAVPLSPFGYGVWMVPGTPVEATTDANGRAVLELSYSADYSYRLTADVDDTRLLDRELRPDDDLRGQRWH